MGLNTLDHDRTPSARIRTPSQRARDGTRVALVAVRDDERGLRRIAFAAGVVAVRAAGVPADGQRVAFPQQQGRLAGRADVAVVPCRVDIAAE
ncbi:conserved hypothetical protein [Ricinus communis]|uniref:Uncharacterized protein n=1 Tax=Ricinus communis TaxID=3988 RepID=B9TJG0_RICCO|nr:conserved hypothetical protein [Ricinus communis]